MDSSEKRIINLQRKAERIFEEEGINLPENAKKIWDELIEELSIYHIELEQQNNELRDLNEKAELQKKEFESLYQNAPNAYFEINKRFEIVKCNKSAYDLLGDNSEIIGQKINAFIHPDEQEKLKQSEERFRSIVNNIKEAIYIYDFDGNFIDCNQEFLNLTGYTKKEITEINAKKLLPENSEAAFLENLKQLRKDKQLIFTTLVQNKQGEKFPTEINATIINYKDKNAILISGRDISDRLKEHKKLIDSERRFRTMADNLTDSVFLHKLTGEFLDINAHALNQLGYSRKEFLKMTPKDLGTDLNTDEEMIEKVNDLIKKGKITFEDEHITKDGHIIPVEITSTIVQYRNEDAVFSVAHDITERKKAEKEQNKLIDQLNHLSNSATKFISLTTFDEIYRYLGKSLNKALEGSMVVVGEFNNEDFTIIDFFGIDKKLIEQIEMITGEKGLHNSFKPDKKRLNLYRTGYLEKVGSIDNMFMNYFDKSARQKISQLTNTGETRIIGVTHDKKLFAGIAIMLNKPLDTIDIEFTQALVYQASIAIQRKTYENDLIKTRDEAEIANKAKTTFLTNISHEIRTPLNTIMGFTEILSNLNDDPLKESYIRSISNSGKNLLMIINDILDLSKIESGGMQINQMVMSIKTLLDEIDYTFRKNAENKGLELDIHIDKNVPDMIQMDQPRLRQILHNLVSNAIKFTNEGKVSIRTIAKKKDESTQLIFHVEDTGIGIDEEKINSILIPFAQADSTDSRKYEGTGMGLSIAKKLTEMLNGELQIQSKPDKGSIFTVILNDIHSSISDADNDKLYNPTRFNKEKILVIGDDMSQLEIIQSVIDKNNLTAFIAESGEQGFAFAFEFKPDFIMINISENHSALDTAKNIKSIDEFNHTPVIGISNTNIIDSEYLMSDALVDEIITPPITEEKMLTVLSKYIENNKSIDENTNPEKEFNFVITDINILTKLTSELEKDVTPLCKELEKRQPLKKVKELSKNLNEISKKYQSPILDEFCENIDNSIKSFDIVKMRELIHNYSKLINALNEKIKKTK